MGKKWTVLGLAMLAGCGGEMTRQIVPTYVHVRIVNNGTEGASGEAGPWENQDDVKFDLGPGESKKFVVAVDYRLKVRIWRTSDNLVLVDDFWDYADLVGKDELLITVSP
jgi:hypothetical protein